MMRSSLIVSAHFIRPVVLMCFCTLAMFGCSSSSSENTSNGTGVADTPTNTTTRVTFDITVPAYMSNELQVRLESGDINTTAAFVRDESWSASATFPVNTTNPLVVTFADGNGAITLGSVDTSFTTAAGVLQTVQVTAGQFDTTRWDSDSDGVSNLDELIAGSNPNVSDPLEPVQVNLEIRPIKTFRINWQPSVSARFYRVLENPDGLSGFSLISDDLIASAQFFDHQVPLFNRMNARYIVQACNMNGCVDSEPLVVTGALDNAIGYFKASNTDARDNFGWSLSLSADGNTMAVGANNERSAVTGINGDQSDNSVVGRGAVYVFVRNDGLWQQQAYLKSSYTNFDWRTEFGASVSLSADGNTLAVGAVSEPSAAIGINGDETNDSAPGAGAVYVFVRSDGGWQQQAYVKASNTDSGDFFGGSVSVSADGNTLVVGADREASAARGLNGVETDNLKGESGAVYIFTRSNGLWQQQAYLKASNTDARDNFGESVSLSADGNTLAVGASNEDSAATGINRDQVDNSATDSGAVYVFALSNGLWQQQAYLKASNADDNDGFGGSLSLSADGNTLAIGASGEDSAASEINGLQEDNSASRAGAAYVFTRNNGSWQQQTYLKANNIDGGDRFGRSVSVSADGNTLAVGAIGGSVGEGAAYVFVHSNGIWRQQAFLMAANNSVNSGLSLGRSVSVSADGNVLAASAIGESSGATGINENPSGPLVGQSGAVYLY